MEVLALRVDALSLEDILSAAALVVGLLAIVVGALAARRWGTRRRRLMFDCTATALIAEGKLEGFAKGELKVTYRGEEIKNPYLVRVVIKNVGPSDVGSAHFDGARPLTVRLECSFFGVIEQPESVTSDFHPSYGVLITFEPALLRRQEEWVVEAIVGGVRLERDYTGRPAALLAELGCPLIDTDVTNLAAERVRRATEVPIP
ncbi:hypothetical protein [Micromonospora inyonensis]|uniref:hypothetical protein n=1 Tax=Micromonospora inyonensis TaxID=47866 RepID=UPI00114C9AF3|nr:hypothetical protein [Micromonospora inyonensis]